MDIASCRPTYLTSSKANTKNVYPTSVHSTKTFHSDAETFLINIARSFYHSATTMMMATCVRMQNYAELDCNIINWIPVNPKCAHL